MLWQRQLISSRRRFTTRALCLSTPRRLNGVAVNSTYATVVAGSKSNSRNCTTVFTAAAKSAPEKNNRQNYSKKAFFSSFAASFALLPRAAHQQCLIAPPPPPPASLFSGQSLISYISTRNKSTSGPKKPSDSNSLGSKRQLPTPACNKIVERNLKDQQQATGKMASASKIRQNYNEISEAAVNKQINLELYASYFYQQLAFHFNRDDVALPGFEKFFAAASKEEREHAEKLMKYQNQRGGRIVLQDIPKPIKQSWSSGLEAMEAALELEKTVNQSLLDLHSIASKHDDPQFADFLESHYLTEQVEAIKKLSDCVTNLRRVGSGLGEYLFDKETLLKS